MPQCLLANMLRLSQVCITLLLCFLSNHANLFSVMDEIDRQGFIPEPLIENEVNWFYNDLGIDDSYFATESINNIVSHILSLRR